MPEMSNETFSCIPSSAAIYIVAQSEECPPEMRDMVK